MRSSPEGSRKPGADPAFAPRTGTSWVPVGMQGQGQGGAAAEKVLRGHKRRIGAGRLPVELPRVDWALLGTSGCNLSVLLAPMQ